MNARTSPGLSTVSQPPAPGKSSAPRRQCAHCPWRKDVDPARDIPGGYSREKHKALASTIAEPGSPAGLAGGLRAMACHETLPGAEKPCVGWLVNQLGEGNNLALRMQVLASRVDANVETIGPQHATLAGTLRRKRAARRGGAL